MANENEKVLKTRLRQKHDIEANWIKAGNASVPFVPLAGEIIIYDDRYVDAEGVEHIVANAVRFKIGNGVDNVNDLAFISFDAILDVGQLPEAGIKSNVFYRTAKSIGTHYINIEGELLQFPVTVYYVDTLPETGIETKVENLLTDGFHIYKQKEDNLTYVYSLDDIDNIVKWGAVDTLIVDTVEELNGEDGIVISESVNSIYTRNSENTDWVQLLSAGDTYTKTEIDEKYLPKIIASDYYERAYTVTKDGQQNMREIVVDTEPDSIVQRDDYGAVKTNVPKENKDAINLQYFNESLLKEYNVDFIPVSDSRIIISVENAGEGPYFATIELYDTHKNDKGLLEDVPVTLDTEVRVIDWLADYLTFAIDDDEYIYVAGIYDESGNYAESFVTTYIPKYITHQDLDEALDGVVFRQHPNVTGAYIANPEGEVSIIPIQSDPTSRSIVLRTSAGNVSTAAPTENYHAATKKYVDDLLATSGGSSVEIVQTTGESETAVMSQKASTEAFLPKIPNSTGEEEVPLIMRDNSVVRRAVSMNALPYRLVMRDDFSNAKFGTPTHEQHAVTLGFADGRYAPLMSYSPSNYTCVLETPIGTRTPAWRPATPTALEWSYMTRKAGGRTEVGEPKELQDATNKEYVDNKVQRLFGITESVEEPVYYDESKLTYFDDVNGCEYDYDAHAISMIFNDSDFAVDNPIYIKFQVCSYSYSATYHAYGYIYKSSDGQIYIGDQAINTDADAALYMYKNGNEIHIIMYLPFESSYFNASASTPFTVSYDESYTSDEIIPEKLLYVTKEIEIYDTVKEAEHAQTATTATTALTATKASQDSNGYSFSTHYAKVPSGNPLWISGNNLVINYIRGNNSVASHSIDLTKATAISTALSSATTAANNAKELIGYEVSGELVTFDETALSYQTLYENCSFSSDYFFIQLAKSDLEANKDKPIYIRIKRNNGQVEDYTIIYSPDNADAEEREPYITAYSSEDITYTYWYENMTHIGLSCHPATVYGGYVAITASCNIPCMVTDDLYEYDDGFTAWLQEVSLEKIEKFTPAACAKGLLAEDGVSKITFEDIKEYIDNAFATLKAELQTYIEQTLLNGEW